jgi:hypothetical protein
LPAVHQTLDWASRYANTRLTDVERLLGARCYRACREGREHTLRQSVPEACRALATASWLAHRPELSAEGSLLLLAEVYPAEAFCEMQWENLPRARQWIDQSMAADFRLETEYGHRMKIAHRLHMATVSASWFLQKEEWQEGCQRCAQILGLLSGKTEALDEPGAWEQDRIDQLPQGMREFIALKVMDILFSTLATHSGRRREQCARIVLDALTPDSLDRLDHSDTDFSAAEFLGLLHAAVAAAVTYGLQIAVALERIRCRQLRTLLAFDATCLLSESGSGLRISTFLAELLGDLAAIPTSFPLRRRLKQRLERLPATANRASCSLAPDFVSTGL